MGLLQKSVVYVFGRAFPALIGVGGVAIYTRMLDPASVGLYALLLSVSLLTSAVGFSWLRVAALRLATTSPDESNDVLMGTILVSFVCTAVVVGAIEVLVLHFIQPGLQPITVTMATLAAAAIAWFELNATMLQARLSVFSWGLLNLARSSAALVFSVLLIWRGFGTDALLAGFILGNCTTAVFIRRIWGGVFASGFSTSVFRRLFVLGWPSSVTAAFSSLSPTFQRYMLVIAAGSSAVGLYSVAADFSSQTLSSIIGSISLAGIPMAYLAKDVGGPLALRLQLLDNARLIFAVSLPATVGLAVLAGPVSHIVFGERFRTGADVIMAIMAGSAMLANLRVYYFDQAFELALETRPLALISFLGTSVVIIMSVVLIPRYHAVGAAISSLSAGALWILMSIVWGRHVLAMPIPIRSWLKTMLAVAGMAFAMEALPPRDDLFGLSLAIAIGGLVYCVLSIVTRFELMRSRFGHRFARVHR